MIPIHLQPTEFMEMLNKVFLIGNLGRDPEVRSTPSGQSVATFSLATNRRWTDRDGNRQNETEWHNIVCWARQAEIAGQYLTRGKQVFVEGRIQTRSWEDRQSGEKKYRTEIICLNFQMLGQRGDSGGGGYGGAPPPEPPTGDTANAKPSTGGDASPQDTDDDDIPF